MVVTSIVTVAASPKSEQTLDADAAEGSAERDPDPPVSWVGNEVEPEPRGLMGSASLPGRSSGRRRRTRLAVPASPKRKTKTEAQSEDDERRENVAYVRSPTPLLPRIEFGPIARRWARRPDILHRISGRMFLLMLIGLVSMPMLWGPMLSALGFGDVGEPEPNVIVPVASDIELVVSGTDVVVDGTVSSEEMRDAVLARLESMLGSDAIVDQLEIDPTVVVDLSGPTRIRLDETVRFESGQSTIVDQYRVVIDTASNMLLADEAVTLLVVGHTDSIGPAERNLLLSVERAEAVLVSVVDRGVEFRQVKIEGRGETEPIGSNEESDGRAQNRRVEFFISGLLG